MMPGLRKKRAVVYFHSNQLPPVGSDVESPLDFVNLNTATSAHELWFNSVYHLRLFLERATAFIEKHPELSARDPLLEMANKVQVMYPPVDLSAVCDASGHEKVARKRRTVFVDTRDADCALLNTAFERLRRAGENYSLITVGPVDELSPDLERRTVSERDQDGQVRALMEAGVIVSTKREAAADHHVIRALNVGCWPVVPNSGVYPELIPQSIQRQCTYDGTADEMVARLKDTWHLERPRGFEQDLLEIIQRYDSINACHAMDDRLQEVVEMPVEAR
jgi:hypothetical protein